MRIKRTLASKTKRGDTIIEAMFAFSIFSLIAIITITMMNLGIAASERSLELVTARNELNAQAEALRFIHSSYIAELMLPELTDDLPAGVDYQQYAGLWRDLKNNAMRACTSDEIAANEDGCFNIEYPLLQCEDVYENNNELLARNNAFVINTRQLISPLNNMGTGYNTKDAIIRATRNNTNIFVSPTLNARILYGPTTRSELDGDDIGNSSDDRISSLSTYTRVAKVEGIWVVAVQGPSTNGVQPQYYDFYVETCWYGSGNATPTSLDAVVRLYNPEGA